jgi:FKBP-type peptidyl-prolyl cis-trans isomerase 2
MKLRFNLWAVALTFLLSFGGQALAEAVSEGSTVTADMTMQLQDGTVVASTKDKDPVTFEMGKKGMFSAIQSGLQGVEVGETKEFVLQPDQAFGAPDPQAVKQVPNENLPENLREVGKNVSISTQDGQTLQARVVKVGEENSTLDFNHPLAGRTLVVTMKVLKVE